MSTQPLLIKNSCMQNLHFYLKSPKERESLILLNYRFNNNRLVMSIGEKVLVNQWNSNSQRVKQVKGFPDYERINYAIENWTNSVRDAISYFEKNAESPTKLELKNKIKELRYPNQKETGLSNNVLKALREYIDNKRDNGSLRKAMWQSFEQLYSNLKTYKNAAALHFKDLNLQTLEMLVDHLSNVNPSTNFNERYSQNQVHKLQRRLIQFLKYCEESNLPVNEAYKSSTWRINRSKVSGNEFALSRHELEIIQKTELNPALDKIRDRFLIGIYSGQRYSDFKNINIDDVIDKGQNKVIKIRQAKTSDVVEIPFNSNLKHLMDKYKGYPPTFTPQYFNRRLKDLFEELGIKDKIKIEREEAGTISHAYIRKCDIVSSHICRRTFVTLAIEKGINLNYIMKVTGHKNLTTLSAYLKNGNYMNDDIHAQYENLF